MSMSKKMGAEFIGTFWLVLGGVAARFWRQVFLSSVSGLSVWPWLLV